MTDRLDNAIQKCYLHIVYCVNAKALYKKVFANTPLAPYKQEGRRSKTV